MKLNLSIHIATLHSEDCWFSKQSCKSLPQPINSNTSSTKIVYEEVLHLLVSKVITAKRLNWDDLYGSFIGSCVD